MILEKKDNISIQTGLTDAEKAALIAARKKTGGIPSLLGFAAKAGKLFSGVDRICDEVRRHGVPGGTAEGIVLIASDASANTEKRIRNACGYYGIRACKTMMTAETLGEKIGSALSSAVAVFDRDFVKGISALLAGQDDM